MPPLPLLRLPCHDPAVGAFIVTGLVTACGLTPRRYWMTPTRSLAFATPVWMIDRVHGNTAIVRTAPQPPLSACFTERDILMLDIADLADRSHARDLHLPNLTR